jgi:hypothetical protein
MGLRSAGRARVAVRRLRLGLCRFPFPVPYLCLVVANEAPHGGTGRRMMPRHMTYYAAHGGALDTAMRARDGRQRGDRHQDDEQQKFSHIDSPL